MSLDNDQIPVQDELATLKARADMLGVKFHPSISLEKLREKVNAAVNSGAVDTSTVDDADSATVIPTAPMPVKETENQKRKRLRDEANRLIRIRVTCMNPAKKEWEGEIFTVGNSSVGTLKKFVPFNADDGWHVPHMIYEQMKDRMCQVFVTTKSKNGVSIRQGKMIKEFAIEVLPQLTRDELQELAQRQAMSRSID